MSQLDINLFGTFQVTVDGRTVSFATEKSRALLAYLAVESDRPHRRESLSGLLWPDKPETAAPNHQRSSLPQ